MSDTEIAIAYTQGFVTTFSFRNGWGSAPYIWDRLCDRYNIEGPFVGSERGESRWEKLFKYHSENTLEPFEHNALVTTYDRYVVDRAGMLFVANSFDRFVEVYPPSWRVCTLAEQAKVIRDAHDRNGAEFLAWTQTTISDSWYRLFDEERDKTEYYDPHTGTDHILADVVPFP
jgi:hypothetical protein